MNAHLLVYDIPKSSGFPNPSGYLWGFGIRINLSAWIVLDGQIPWSLLHDMTEAGCNHYLLRFDESMGEKIIEAGITEIRKELEAQIARCRRTARRADVALSNATGDINDAIKKHRDKRNAIRRRIKKLTDRLKATAAMFGIHENQLPISRTLNAVHAIRQQMTVTCREYVTTTAAIQDRSGNSDPVALAARRDQIPPEILADYAEDRGIDTTQLRNALNGKPSRKKSPPVDLFGFMKRKC